MSLRDFHSCKRLESPTPLTQLATWSTPALEKNEQRVASACSHEVARVLREVCFPSRCRCAGERATQWRKVPHELPEVHGVRSVYKHGELRQRVAPLVFRRRWFTTPWNDSWHFPSCKI
eukprot:10125120-Alexandrium_andersonii.AAC.1